MGLQKQFAKMNKMLKQIHLLKKFITLKKIRNEDIDEGQA